MFKQFILTAFLISTIGLAFALPLTGEKVIYGAGGYDYLTITAAINDLNTNGVGAGGVTFLVVGTFYENPPAITVSGSEANPILFSRAEGWEAVVVPTGGVGTYGFKLSGADYVTFDAVDINGSASLVYGYWLEGITNNGPQHNTIRNCHISVPNPGTNNYGIYFKNDNFSNNVSSSNLFQNNTISSSYYGIYISVYGYDANACLDNTVQGNILTNIRGTAFFHEGGVNTLITGNNVSFISASPYDLTLVETYGVNSSITVSNNTFSGGSGLMNVMGFMHQDGQSLFENNTVSNINNNNYTWTGFFANHGNADFSHNTISNITSSAICFFYGARLILGSHTMRDNEISGISSYGDLIGVKIEEGTTHYIKNNKIHGLHYVGTANLPLVRGMEINGVTDNYIINNMIYDLTSSQVLPIHVTGMHITNLGTNHIWNNTIYLNASGTASQYTTALINIIFDDAVMDLRNNILVNKSTPGSNGYTYVLKSPVAGFSYFSPQTDRNIYYAGTPSPRNLIGYFSSTPYQTLAAYKAATATFDQNSFTENVPFVSSTGVINPHINPTVPTVVEGNAEYIAEVSTDIDGDLRNVTTPDIGADEGNFTVYVVPPLTGIKTINPAGGDYLSFTEAITDLNNYGVGAGGVTFMAAGVTFAETPPDITASGTATNPIMFTSMTTTHPVIIPSGAVLPNALCVMGGDYITFNNIDIEGPSNLLRAFELTALENNPVTHVTIQNCHINYPSSAGLFLAGIQSYSNVNAQNSYITIQNNTISNVTAGVIISYSYPENTSSNIIIQNNILTDINQYGIYVLNAINTSVTGNQISFMTAASNEIYGIITTGAASSVSIHNNAIYSGSSISDLRGITRESGNADIYANSITSLSFVATNGSYAFKLMEGSGTCNDNLVAGLVNSGTDEFHGYFVTQGTNTLSGNEIRNVSSAGIRTIGINVSGGTNTIKNNNIHQLNYYAGAGGQVTGIKIYGGTSHNVYNNLIYDLQNPNGTDGLQIVGIKLLTSSAINVWHNTVYLDAISNYPTFYTVALLIDSVNELDPVLVKNNIFVNCSSTNTNGCAIAYGQTSELTPNIAPGSDNNIYYAGIPDDYHLIAYMGGNTYPTLDGYKIAAGTVDQNSYTENVPFISAVYPYNLHVSSTIPTAVESHGISIPEVTTDMDGDPRNALTPDIGADEGNFISTDLPPAVPDVTIHYTNGATPFVWLSWNAVTGATWYNVYVSAVPSDDMTDYTYIGGTTGTNWPDMGEIESWKFYKVTSEN